MKRCFLFVVAFAIIVGFSVVSVEGEIKAQSKAPFKKPPVAQKTYYDDETGQTITDIYLITDEGYKELSFEEFKKIRSEGKKFSEKLMGLQSNTEIKSYESINNPIVPLAVLWSTFTKSSETAVWYDQIHQVTNPYYCPTGSSGCTTTLTYSLTKAEQFTAGIDGTVKSVIKGAISYSWNSSASILASYTLGIPAGKTGYVNFMPASYLVLGSYETWSITPYGSALIASGFAYGATPRKLVTGMLEGIVYGVVS